MSLICRIHGALYLCVPCVYGAVLWFWKDRVDSYGGFSFIIHWVMAAMVILVFFFGWYRTTLDYYHPWYFYSSDIHRSVGILVLLLLCVRVVRKLSGSSVIITGSRWERLAAKMAHTCMYVLMFSAGISGYMVSTAKGAGVDVFGAFVVPAVVTGDTVSQILSERVHFFSVWSLAGVVIVHILAAAKRIAKGERRMVSFPVYKTGGGG